jgi:hypothetical protein
MTTIDVNASYSSQTSTSAGVRPARSNASRPDRAAGDSVKSGHWLIVLCEVASPVPSTHTGCLAQSRARSSEVSTTAPPPSLRMQQCSFVNGSAIIRLFCTSSIVIGSR